MLNNIIVAILYIVLALGMFGIGIWKEEIPERRVVLILLGTVAIVLAIAVFIQGVIPVLPYY